MLGPDLSVRRFTSQAERLLGLSSVDMGRPINMIKLRINIAHLEHLVLDVIRDVLPAKDTFQDQNGGWYELRITPYRTSDNKIEGAVLVFLDSSDIKDPLSREEKPKKRK